MSDDVGTVVARRVIDDDGTSRVELLQADDRIAVSRELLADHYPAYMQVDDDRLVICGVFYLATGETHYGHPVYRRVANEGDLP